jgi:hypothetical protein
VIDGPGSRTDADPRPSLDGSKCALYLPGHQVHFVQAAHSSREPRRPQTGQVTSVSGGYVTVAFPSKVRVYRNHLTRQLRAAVEQGGSEVVVDEGWSILFVPQLDAPGGAIDAPELVARDGTVYCFSIAEADKAWTQCRREPLTPSEVDSLGAGGYTVSDGPFRLVGAVLTIDAPGASEDEPHSFILRAGSVCTVEVTRDTVFTGPDHGRTSFANIQIGTRVEVLATKSGSTYKATSVVIDPLGRKAQSPDETDNF